MGEFAMSDDQVVSSTTGDAAAGHPVLLAIGWVSVGLGIAAVGLMVGRELRKRYRFNHRTPYDFYSNAGASAVSEFGMGV
jgi:hypothetical protein